MKWTRLSTAPLFLLVAALVGCGGGAGAGSTGGSGGSGSSGGSGGGSSFQPRPFPGDFFATPPVSETGPSFPGNVVYDSYLKEFFFSNPSMDEVEAYSTVDGHRVGSVTVPGAAGLSLSPDGSKLAVGTSTPHVYFVDPAALHVTGEIEVPHVFLDSVMGEYEPELPILMASGPMLIEIAYPGAIFTANIDGRLISYDPASGTFASSNPPDSSNGSWVTPQSRSLDGKYLAVATWGQTEHMTVYSAESQTYIGCTSDYHIHTLAANPDGSQFVTIGTPPTSDVPTVTFWDRNCQQQGQLEVTPWYTNAVYSRDGSLLYLRESSNVVLAIDTKTGLPAGYQGLSIATTQSGYLSDADESNRVYGITDLGAFIASVAKPQPTNPLLGQYSENFYGSSIGIPNEGPLSGGTQVQFKPNSVDSGNPDGMDSTTEAYFGTVPATSDVAAGGYLTATTPATTKGGPVTVLLADANNNAVLLPDAFSYGPHANWIDPSAVPYNRKTISTLWTDGLEPFRDNIPIVTVGGEPVGVTLPTDSGVDIRDLEVELVGSNPGWADLKVSFWVDGTSETTKNMVQFLTQYAEITSPTYTSAVYDPSRDRFYLTGADNTVGVFDPQSQTLLQPMTSSAISAGAVLGSLALTPDNSKLLVSDPADHSLVVFNLADGTSTAVDVLVPTDVSTTVSAPMPVVALTENRALVLLTPWTQNEMREIDLTQMTVQVRTDVQNADFALVAPSTMAASTDGSVALLGALGPSASYVWKYDPASDSFSAPTTNFSAKTRSVAVNADGTVLGLGIYALDQDLSPLVPFRLWRNNLQFTGSGSLRYIAGNQVEISDSHNGRELLRLSPVNGQATALAIDPTGRTILVCAGTTLYYFELAAVPLAAISASPANATPGTGITIHGNGFVAGTTAEIAGKSASCSMVDSQTLHCVVPNVNAGLAPITLSNPDGQTYSIEGALNVE